jgi:hypothetical protein
MSVILALSTGLVAGAIHVVSGPDHLAALAPIAIDEPKRAMRMGATWGLGHGLGVCALGGLGLAVRQVVDISALSAGSEFLVGLTLIGIGVFAIRRATRLSVHAHEHSHGDAAHRHLHVHVDEPDHAHGVHGHSLHSHAALGVGFLHGAAGTGHLFGVIPALALPTEYAAIYILAYLSSAVGSMMLFGSLLGRVAQRRGTRWMRGLSLASGAMALVVGVIWTVTSWPFGV